MKENKLISAKTLCLYYNIDYSFFDDLSRVGLIQVEIVEHNQFIYKNQISELEKIIRLHLELNVNMEGIDVVFNLLDNEMKLRHELIALKNRLRFYENG